MYDESAYEDPDDQYSILNKTRLNPPYLTLEQQQFAQTCFGKDYDSLTQEQILAVICSDDTSYTTGREADGRDTVQKIYKHCFEKTTQSFKEKCPVFSTRMEHLFKRVCLKYYDKDNARCEDIIKTIIVRARSENGFENSQVKNLCEFVGYNGTLESELNQACQFLRSTATLRTSPQCLTKEKFQSLVSKALELKSPKDKKNFQAAMHDTTAKKKQLDFFESIAEQQDFFSDNMKELLKAEFNVDYNQATEAQKLITICVRASKRGGFDNTAVRKLCDFIGYNGTNSKELLKKVRAQLLTRDEQKAFKGNTISSILITRGLENTDTSEITNLLSEGDEHLSNRETIILTVIRKGLSEPTGSKAQQDFSKLLENLNLDPKNEIDNGLDAITVALNDHSSDYLGIRIEKAYNGIGEAHNSSISFKPMR